MSMKDAPSPRSRRWFSAGSALLLAVAAGTVALGAAALGGPRRPGTPDRRHRLPAGHARQGRRPRSASRCRSRCCRTARSCTPPATARCAAPTRPAPPRVIGTLPVYTHDEEGLQGVGVDPSFATNRYIYLYYAPPLTTPAGDAPATGTARLRRLDGRQPALPVHPQRRLHAQHGQQGRRPRRARRPGHLLPRRRRHRLRRGRQPLPVHRRRHQPVRLGRLRAARRADQPQPRLRRAAHRRQHQRPARQDPADQGERQRHVLDPGGQPVRARHRAAPGPRSTRWASATRSG